LLPAETGLGVPLFVTARSQATVTGVLMVVLLLAELGSLVLEETEEFAVIEAATTVDGTFTATMMLADAPEARLGSVQVTEAVITQDQPAGADTETKVVLVGIASVKLTEAAAPGPLLVTVWV